MAKQELTNRQKWVKGSIGAKQKAARPGLGSAVRKAVEAPADDDAHLTKEQKIFRWYREKALDLSRRNRLLKYPDKGAKLEFDLTLDKCNSYLGIPSEIYVEFPHKKILDAEAARKKRMEEGVAPTDDEDDGMRTILKGEKLLNCLTRLQRLSARTFKEHGLNTLFLAVGEVCWKTTLKVRGSADKVREQIYIAPAMLVPVGLATPREKVKRSILEVDLSLYPIQLNPVLLTWMQQNQLVVPKAPSSITSGYDWLPQVLQQFKDSFQEGMIDATVSEKVYVGQFTFHGQQIYEDLKRHEPQMLKHDFIGSICGGLLEQENSSGAIDDDSEGGPDDFFTPEDDYTIHDSDSSQTDAIRAVLSGKHVVIHGPPGTGKSQTIANIISNLLARKKKVLFVCEKQAALDVVYKQKMTFDSVNLADLCLPLYEYRAAKKSFARDLVNSRDRVIKNLNDYGHREYDEVLEKRSKRIEIIKRYSHAVITPTSSLQRSPYWVFGELARLSDIAKEMRVPWESQAALEMPLDQIEEQCSVLKDLNQYKVLLEVKDTHKWRYVLRKHSTAGVGRSILAAFKDLRRHLSKPEFGEAYREAQSLEDEEKIVAVCTDPKRYISLTPTVSNAEPFAKIDFAKAQTLVKRAVVAAKAYRKLTTDRQMELPVEWTMAKLEHLDALSETASLPRFLTLQVRTAVDAIAEHLKSLPRKLTKQLSSLSVQQYRQRARLYSIDDELLPILKLSKNDLQSAQKMATDVEALASQLAYAESVLSKYGVHIGDLNDTEVSGLEQRFATGYKSFFRIFSSSYKRDRFLVEKWCINAKPNSFRAVKNLVESAANRTRSKRRYEEEFAKLRSLCVISELQKVSSAVVKSAIDTVARYLELASKESIETEVLDIMSQPERKNISARVALVVEQFLPQWSIVSDFASRDIDTMSLSSASDFVTSFREAYDEVSTLHAAINRYMKTNPIQYTTKDLRNDIDVLNTAATHVRNLGDDGLSDLLGVTLNEIVTNEHILSIVATHIDTLDIIRSRLAEKCNARQLYSYCDIVQRNHKAIQTWHATFDADVQSLGELVENPRIKEIKALSRAALDLLLKELETDSVGLEEWMRFQHRKHLADEHGLNWFVDAIAPRASNVFLEEVYLASFYAEWIERLCDQEPILKGFDVEKHERVVNEFRELDEQSLKVNRMRILTTLKRDIAQSRINSYTAERVIRREAEKSRQHKPIRELVENYAAHIQAMKPCWMLSPLTIGSYLKYGSVEFDVVIFDEASQMTVENALGAIARARQVVVIGDEHQLPPTPFFNFSSADDEDEDEEVVESIGYESILKSAISLLGGSKTHTYLKYHYRSKSEDLIAFSNHYIYSYFNQPLVTFPSATPNKRGVEFIHVNGVYKYDTERNTNRVEAQKIVDICIDHAKTTPDKSLGVIAFSAAQEEEVRECLQARLKTRPDLQAVLDEESEDREAFFITNLESVQGDERDTVLLSVCYGKDPKGVFAQRFGPLNSVHGYRRLNVAVTRAREKMVCVASIYAHDIKVGEGTQRGVELLQKYLEYAKSGIETLNASKIAQPGPDAETDSEFETAVESALQKRGYSLRRQVGASGYKIDLAVLNPGRQNEYVLGIECDGAAYHSSHSARERDKIRQDVLEAYGWRMYRIWSQHWFEHREDVLDDIEHEIKRLLRTAV